VGGGAVKIAKDGDRFTATEIWRKPNKSINHWSTPVYRDGFLYGMFSFKDYGKGPIKCVNIATGEEAWSQDGFGPGGVVLAGDQLVVLSDKGQLVLVEASSKAYTETARFQAIEGKCWNTFSLSNGRAYVRSTKEGACIDLTMSGK
jgi:outer membrane protein assembly factor BamB